MIAVAAQNLPLSSHTNYLHLGRARVGRARVGRARVGRVLFDAIIALTLSLLVYAVPALAAEPQQPSRTPTQLQYLGENTGRSVADAGLAPYRLALHDLPRRAGLLRQSLWAEQPKGTRIGQQAWFQRNGRLTHLAILWDLSDAIWPEQGENRLERLLVLHRLSDDGVAVRAEKLIQATDEHIRIVEPSGSDPFDEGVGLLFLDFGSGGSDASGYQMAILRLDDQLSDATPSGYGRVVLADYLPPQGQFAVVAADDRWRGYGLGCGQCGPIVPVVLVRRQGQYEEACAAFPAYYQTRIGFSQERVSDGSERRSLGDFFDNQVKLILYYAQIGRLVEAQAHYRALPKESEAVIAASIRDGRLSLAEADRRQQQRTDLLAALVRDIGPILTSAEASTRSCRLQSRVGNGASEPYAWLNGRRPP